MLHVCLESAATHANSGRRCSTSREASSPSRRFTSQMESLPIKQTQNWTCGQNTLRHATGTRAHQRDLLLRLSFVVFFSCSFFHDPTWRRSEHLTKQRTSRQTKKKLARQHSSTRAGGVRLNQRTVHHQTPSLPRHGRRASNGATWSRGARLEGRSRSFERRWWR